MPHKTKLQIAHDAQEKHERLYRKTQEQAGQPGIARLRFRMEAALLERMEAERDAGLWPA